MDALKAISRRRSIGRLVEPAPTEEELHTLINAAVVAPDHGRMRPWRFVILRGEAKDAFGEVMVKALRRRCAEPTEAQLVKERTKLNRAPLVVVVAAARPPVDKVPWEEQLMAVAAAIQNMLIAATALGYASMWRTGDPAYDTTVKSALGLHDDDAIVGFVYLGTPAEGSEKPPNEPILATDMVTHWRVS